MNYYNSTAYHMLNHFSLPAEHHVTLGSIWTHRNEILLFFPQGCRIITPIGTLIATPPVPKITPSGALHAESEWGWRVSDIIHSMRVNPNECRVIGPGILEDPETPELEVPGPDSCAACGAWLHPQERLHGDGSCLSCFIS